MASFAILARNAFSNWAVFIANMVATLILSPLVVRELGSSQYGIWVFISTVTGYLGLVEAGVTVSTGRFLNYHLGRGDRGAAQATISTALAFYGAVSVLLVILVLAFAGPIGRLATPSLSVDGPTLQAIVLLLTVNVGGLFVGAVYSQLLHAANRFDLKNLALLASLAFRFVATVVVLQGGGALYELAWVQLGSTVLATVAMVAAAAFWGPGVSMRLQSVSRAAMGELLGFGKWAFANNVASRLDGQSSVVVTGVYLDARSVAHYSVAQMLVEYGVQLVQNVVSVAGPDLTKHVGRGDLASVERFVDSGGRVAAFFGAPVLAGVAVFGPDFVTLWMGPEFASTAWVMVLLAAAKSMFLASTSLGMAVWAIGQIRLLTVLNLVSSVLGIVLAIALVSHGQLGLEAMAISALIVSIFQWMVVQPLVAARLLNLPVRRFYRVVVLRYGAALVAFLIPAIAIQHVLEIDSWFVFVLAALAAVMLYLPMAAMALWGARQSWQAVVASLRLVMARFKPAVP